MVNHCLVCNHALMHRWLTKIPLPSKRPKRQQSRKLRLSPCQRRQLSRKLLSSDCLLRMTAPKLSSTPLLKQQWRPRPQRRQLPNPQHPLRWTLHWKLELLFFTTVDTCIAKGKIILLLGLSYTTDLYCLGQFYRMYVSLLYMILTHSTPNADSWYNVCCCWSLSNTKPYLL